MAGYNSGDLTVKKAIKEYKSRDFWYLSQYTFPKQTKDYVPQILAVIHISKNLEKFGFSDKIVQPIENFDKITGMKNRIGLPVNNLAQIVNVENFVDPIKVITLPELLSNIHKKSIIIKKTLNNSKSPKWKTLKHRILKELQS